MVPAAQPAPAADDAAGEGDDDMDDPTPPRRALAGASAIGAAALLVLSFGPSALALTPSDSSVHAVPPAHVAVTAQQATSTAEAISRPEDDQEVVAGSAPEEA